MNIYFVFYRVIGSRCTGSYFVAANNADEAKKKVKALWPDYCDLRALTLKDAALEYSMEEEELVDDMSEYSRKMVDGIYHIESGT